MKVLFTAHLDSHINNFHLPYLKWFKENNYEVHVATNSNKKIKYCDNKYHIPINRKPFKLINIKAYKKIFKIIKKENYDIIHCHTPIASVITRLATKKIKRNKPKIIYTAHGFHFHKKSSIFNWIIYYPIEKWLAKYTDLIITINEEDYQKANKKFKSIIKFINGTGVDCQRFKTLNKKEKNDLKHQLNLKEKDFILIFPAEFTKRKNQIMLIKIMAQLTKNNSDIKLLLPGGGALKKYYQIKINKLKLNNHIFLFNFRNDIAKLLQISNILISSSKREGLPINIIEGMTASLPIIATNIRGHTDLLRNYPNGYLVNNKKEMIEKIMLIKKQPSYKRIIPNKDSNIQKYYLKNILKEMEIVYRFIENYEK